MICEVKDVLYGSDAYIEDFSQRLSQFVKRWRHLLIVGSGLWLGLMILLHVQSFVSIGDITRDPATIALHPPYYGALSNLSILLWSASAAICFLSAVLLNILQPKSDSGLFFGLFAGLSTVLCLDDTYLLHEAILPNRLPGISISESVVVLTYALTLLGGILYFRKLILKTQVWLFSISLGLFIIAVSIDQLLPKTLIAEDTFFLIEDGFKLLAIFFWLAYFVRSSIDLIVTVVNRRV